MILFKIVQYYFPISEYLAVVGLVYDGIIAIYLPSGQFQLLNTTEEPEVHDIPIYK